jgi:general secretion pathway protein L
MSAMLAAYFEWWTRQWQSLLPPSLKPGDGSSDLTVAVETLRDIADGNITISAPGQRTIFLSLTGEGPSDLRAMRGSARQRLRLKLPPGVILERTVSLPAAVERDLGQVLHYEMDRLTPFAAGDVFWDWALLRHDKRTGKLDIRLTLAKRDMLAPLLARLEEFGLYPDCLESAGGRPGAAPRVIWLRRAREAGAGRNPVRVAAFGLCAILLLALVGLPFVRQQMALATINQQIADLQPTVRAAAKLRRAIEADAESGIVLQLERHAAGNPLEVIAAVTDALPDGTWLTQFSLQQRTLHIEGESQAAAQLIGRLATINVIGNPAFVAPVTTDSDHHADVFAISAGVRP